MKNIPNRFIAIVNPDDIKEPALNLEGKKEMISQIQFLHFQHNLPNFTSILITISILFSKETHK